MTIGKKLIGGCVLSLVVTLALGFSSISAVDKLSAELDRAINFTSKKVLQAEDVRVAVEKMAALQRGVLADQVMKKMNDVGRFKAQFRESVATVRQTLGELRPNLETEQGRQAVDLMTTAIERWNESFDEMDRLCDAGNFEAADAVRVGKSRPLYSQMQDGAKMLVGAANVILEKAAEEARTLEQVRNTVAWSLMLVAFLVGGVLLYVVWQSVQDLRAVATLMVSSSEQVTQTAGQVAAGSQSLAQGASEQAASLEETSASTEEINSMVRSNATSSRQAAGTVRQSGQKFDAANLLLGQMVTAMQGVNTSSEKISRIIKVIEEIAFQTNILALNAAVEAARAGEAGMGFAVVAGEVRNLAQRCSQAAKDTSALIEESIAMSKGGTAKVESVASAIAQITEDASAVARLVDEIHAGSEQQASGIEQIARAVQHMESVTQTTASAAEASAKVADELHTQARAFSDQAARLQGIVGKADTELLVRAGRG